jgi:hypothetical protein
VGLLSTRRSDEYVDRASYALVQEDHCKGHFEEREITISDYRKEQGVVEYDDHGRAWRQLVLKMKSAGPSIGSLSKTSLQFFFMASYDMDRFREFIKSEGFNSTFEIDDDLRQKLYEDDLELMRFGDRMIRQIMFGEETLAKKGDAYDQLVNRREEQRRIRDELEAEGGEEVE